MIGQVVGVAELGAPGSAPKISDGIGFGKWKPSFFDTKRPKFVAVKMEVVMVTLLGVLGMGCDSGGDGEGKDTASQEKDGHFTDIMAESELNSPDSGWKDSGIGDVETEPDGDTAETALLPQCWTDLAIGEKQIFATPFVDGTEGIAFGADGAMYASTGKSGTVWRVGADGIAEPWALVPQAIGLASAPNGDLLVASLGPSTAKGTPDGALYRVTGQDQATLWADGIDSPNFVVALADGSAWVSDDFDTVIHHIDADGSVASAVTNIGSPNGMGLNLQKDALFVASTFTPDGEITRIPIDDQGKLMADGWEILAKFGPVAFPDGLAVDELGDVYVAINFEGRVVRLLPQENSPVQDIATGIQNPASIAFGKAPDYDPCSIYVTELLGKHIWRISVGRRGLKM